MIFPALTGGLWIKRPGLKLELTELAVPVLIVAILGLALRAFAGARLEEASSSRLVQKLWSRWSAAIAPDSKDTQRLLGFAALCVGAVWTLASLRRHWAFGSGASDLGIFTNAISNLVHGRGYISSVKDGMNLFADHQSPVFWLCAPFYTLFPHPETLLVLQGFGLAIGAIFLHRIAAQFLPRGHWAIAVAPLLYWNYLPLRNANAFDFHPEVFMLPILLGAIAGLQSKTTLSRIGGALAIIAGLGAKESAGPVVAALGFAWTIGASPAESRSFTRKIGFILIVAGVAAFLFDLKVVPNLMGGAGYAYDAQYARYGGGLKGLLLAPFTHPGLLLEDLFGRARLKFLFWTLIPLALAPLLNPRAALVALPGYLMLFLSQGDHRVNPIYHYAIEPAVGLFFALPLGLDRLAKLVTEKSARRSLKSALIFILFCALVTFGRSEMFRIRVNSPTEHQAWLRHELLPLASMETDWVVSGSLVPHLATRPWAHHLPRFVKPNGSPVACAIFDSEINNWPLTTPEFRSISDEFNRLNYTKVFECGPTSVYQLAGSTPSCLTSAPHCP